jgi:hypothetical protein
MADFPGNDELADTAQALPLRPGAGAVQHRRFKGTVTAGRPLPPRAGEIHAVAADVAPVAAPAAAPRVAAPQPPLQVAQVPPVSRPSKPDARPMRFVFGAGAVAAVSVLTIGLVKPDWSVASDEQANTTSQDAVSAAIDATDPSSPRTRVKGRVRHVTEYVFLAPGEKAPRGATVISNNKYLTLTGTQPSDPAAPAVDPTARPGVASKPDRQPAANSNNNPTPQADKPAADKPAADKPATPDRPAADKPAPAPPRPPVTTRQSGS